MKIDAIMKVLKEASTVSDFYNSVYKMLLEMRANKPDEFFTVTNELESKNFSGAVNVIMYFRKVFR